MKNINRKTELALFGYINADNVVIFMDKYCPELYEKMNNYLFCGGTVMQKRALRAGATVSLAVAASMFFGIFLSVFSNAGDTNIVIFHTNDIHGNVNSVQTDGVLNRIGLDIIKNAKDSTQDSILIDAGDALQGTPEGKYSKGADIVKMMNAAGYDGMTLGNHEFDYGSDAVLECAKAATFPVVSANTYKSGEPFLKGINEGNGRDFIKEISGKKVGFFGITTEETNRTTIPPNLEGIEFRNEIEVSREEVKRLREQKVDIIVGIMHVGVDSSSKVTSYDIAKKVSGIDIIIDGHSHTKLVDKVNGTVISQTGMGASNLGRIDIRFHGPNMSIDAVLIPASEVGRMFVPENSITKMYDDIYSNISPLIERVIGKTTGTFYGGTYNGKNISRFVETNMGDLICDSMIWSGKKLIQGTDMEKLPVVAFENGGAVRSGINLGYIKMSNVSDVLPLDNKLSVQVITPKRLYQVLERGVGRLTLKAAGEPLTGPFGGFPQIGGMKIEVDIYATPYDYDKNLGGQRVKNITLIDSDGNEGMSLSSDDDKTMIVFLCNDYTIYEFPAVANEEIRVKGKYLSDTLAEYISKLTFESEGEFSYSISKGRVILKKIDSFFKPYTAELTIKDGTGALGNTAVAFNIDSTESKQLTTDDDGHINLEGLSTGQHTVRVFYGGMTSEVYINDQIGMDSNTVILSDSSDRDISSVSNIIGQIPYTVTADAKDIINFARLSYNSLSERSGEKVINYNKLQRAEERLLYLNGEDYDNKGLPKMDGNRTIVTAVFICVILSGLVVIWLIRKRSVTK